MLESLNFVKGAIDEKGNALYMRSLKISNGRITASSWVVTISSPIACDLDVRPSAKLFTKSIEQCGESITLALTKSNKISVKSGDFRSLVDCSSIDQFPDIFPVGEKIKLDFPLRDCLQTIEPFISKDNRRPFSNTVKFSGNSIYATNNAVFVEYYSPIRFPLDVCLPLSAVKEILRIKENPISIQMCSESITLHYEGDRWLNARVSGYVWPDIETLFKNYWPESPDYFEDTGTLTDNLKTISDFTDGIGRVFLLGGKLSTHVDLEKAQCVVEQESVRRGGVFTCSNLLLVASNSNEIDFSAYPQPCSFAGENLRGLIAPCSNPNV